MKQDPSKDTASRWMRIALRLVAIVLGAGHAAVAMMQQSMNEDGINYLDMGDAYLDGNWAEAISSVWSPVYGLLIAAAVRVSEPTVWTEFPVVQVANFALYIVALLCFEFFWNRLTSRHYWDNGIPGASAGFPPIAWDAIGYSLFIWSSLGLIQIWSVTPDMTVAAVVYLAAGMLLTLPDSSARHGSAIVLGLILGFGYLVKAALLPLGIFGLVVAALSGQASPGRRAQNFALSLAAMLLVAGPLLGALSWKAGELTMGDVGRFTYLKHVNEMPYPDFHDAIDRLHGTPANPPRRVFDEPPVYEFAEPVAGTYPMAYDAGYWTAGLEPVVSVGRQGRALLTSGLTYFDLFVRQQGGVLALVLLLVIISNNRGLRLTGPAALVLWSLAAFGMYSIVHVLPRYIAPFVLLFWSGILADLRFADDAPKRKLSSVGATLIAVFIWINIAAFNLDGLRRVIGFTPLSESASQPAPAVLHREVSHPDIADQLLRMGLRRGDTVGFIGYSYSEYWARLARLRIIAEIHWHDVPRFWNATAESQAGALAAFAESGAVAVISEPVSIDALPRGWRAVGDSGYVIYRFRQD